MRAEVPRLAEWGAQQVELAASTALGKSYEKPNIAARFYPANSLPSEEELKADLRTAMKIMKTSAHLAGTAKPRQLNLFTINRAHDFEILIKRISKTVAYKLNSSWIARFRKFAATFGLITSRQAFSHSHRPIRGSGKTKFAHALASWLTDQKTSTVLLQWGGWTNKYENVVGYQDALQPDIYRRAFKRIAGGNFACGGRYRPSVFPDSG